MTVKVYVRAPVTNPAVIDFVRGEVQRCPKPDNLYKFALMLHDLGDEANDKEMFESLKKASESGHADATSLLGDCYFFGVGTEMDKKKGTELFIKSAEMGSVLGCYSAGNELLFGKNVEPDYPRAYRYLKKAAKDGDDRAINSLGIMYLYGHHVKQNRRKAEKLFMKSASMGNEQAALNCRKLRSIGKDADISVIPILKSSEIPKDGEKK